MRTRSCSKFIRYATTRCYSTSPSPSSSSSSLFSPEGVYAPIITPFEKGGGKVAVKHIRENSGKLLDSKLDGLVVLGSNGEFPLLSYQEKIQVLEAVSKENKEKGKRKKLIAGTGCVSTQETIDLTQCAAELGYDAAMIVTPYYYTSRITSAVLRDHFTAVADKSPIPIILYNVPPFTGITIPVDLISDLSSHKNIVGVKDTTGSIAQISETVRRKKKDSFVVLAGSGGYFLHSIFAGARGAVAALANLYPDEVAKIWELYKTQKFSEAQILQDGLTPVNDVATAKCGIAGLKYACELRKLHGGDPRPPVPFVTEAQKKEIQAVLEIFEKSRNVV